MSTADVSGGTRAEVPGTRTADVRLEVVLLGVSDVDRAKAFHESLGWRLDADVAGENDFRVVQLTPPGSTCSIIFGSKVTSAAPGAAEVQIAVHARDEHGMDEVPPEVRDPHRRAHHRPDTCRIGLHRLLPDGRDRVRIRAARCGAAARACGSPVRSGRAGERVVERDRSSRPLLAQRRTASARSRPATRRHLGQVRHAARRVQNPARGLEVQSPRGAGAADRRRPGP